MTSPTSLASEQILEWIELAYGALERSDPHLAALLASMSDEARAEAKLRLQAAIVMIDRDDQTEH